MVIDHQEKHDSQWAAICPIAENIVCSAETLRNWIRQVERDEGRRPGLTTEGKAAMEGSGAGEPGIAPGQ